MSEKEIIKIEEYNLIDFISAIEKKVKEGFCVSDTNEGVPSQWGPGMYVCEVFRDKPKQMEPAGKATRNPRKKT